MRVILADSEADMAARALFEDQHGAGDGGHCLAEQQPVSGPKGIGAEGTKKWLTGQGHADAGLHEIAAPQGFGRIAQAADVTLQPVHQPVAVTRFVAGKRGFGLGDSGHGALWRLCGRATVCRDQLPDRGQFALPSIRQWCRGDGPVCPIRSGSGGWHLQCLSAWDRSFCPSPGQQKTRLWGGSGRTGG